MLGPQSAGYGADAVRAGTDRLPVRRRRVPVTGTRGIGLAQTAAAALPSPGNDDPGGQSPEGEVNVAVNVRI